LALSILVMFFAAVSADIYDYVHAWVSAHYATIARSFVEHGVFELGGVPIQNNPPLTTQPDAYLNWPPLYPILLSAVFSIFGSSEVVHHLTVMTINLGIACAVFAIVSRQGGRFAGAIAAIAFLNAPVIARYGLLGAQLHLALLLCLASLWAFARATDPAPSDTDRRRTLATVGAALFASSVLTSWEPILALPGIAAVALLRKDGHALRLAYLYGLAGLAAVVLVVALYSSQYPYFGGAITNRLLLRAGFHVSYSTDTLEIFGSPHFVQQRSDPAMSVTLMYFVMMVYHLAMVGPIGLLGLAVTALGAQRLIKDRNLALAYPLVGLLSMFGLWCVLMNQHMKIHEYQMLMLAPAAALAAGLVASDLLRLSRESWPRPIVVSTALLIAVPSVAMISRAEESVTFIFGHRWRQELPGDIQFARAVRNATPPGAIVIHPSPSMVPVYYSERHTIRAISDEKLLAEQRQNIERLCEDCAIYVAIPKVNEGGFSGLIDREPSRPLGDLGTLVTLRPPR
jgi:4-amino-4-deoxy-L-arabinose transferase-like glycosyltransferase